MNGAMARIDSEIGADVTIISGEASLIEAGGKKNKHYSVTHRNNKREEATNARHKSTERRSKTSRHQRHHRRQHKDKDVKALSPEPSEMTTSGTTLVDNGGDVKPSHCRHRRHHHHHHHKGQVDHARSVEQQVMVTKQTKRQLLDGGCEKPSHHHHRRTHDKHQKGQVNHATSFNEQNIKDTVTKKKKHHRQDRRHHKDHNCHHKTHHKNPDKNKDNDDNDIRMKDTLEKFKEVYDILDQEQERQKANGTADNALSLDFLLCKSSDSFYYFEPDD